ncbi:acyl-CoA carboxylase subunit beta [Pelobacter propionicus]|jgi:methylmalonyl-CoA carboxyltransferase 12S subunit|uniref:Carboxyl transferase n=1 Tax=Pelobacter propionicus (strain DSM 2379 / NBRC 103807 / OttBd1) TaxID=338966 RepID=A1AK04_PELPD|nr:acyl-CoA carboxylase subunit beta [Pelobacter propionicus]ABK97674.1 carboxyl transferase [Pelobacter propionicus DSM 2379]ABL00679.1 carboxyl transferase [Pelobacter propionicus DSM 2379]
MAITIEDRIQELNDKKAEIALGGGRARIEKQHAAGSMTARERLDYMLDQDSFLESGMYAKHRCTYFGMEGKVLPAEGVVTGAGTIDGRLVHVASQDFTVAGGAVGEVHADKIVRAMEDALKTGSPCVVINDSGGARIQEGNHSLGGYGRIFYANVKASGVIPQISIIAGPCAGGAVYSPALTDFIIQTKSARMFITGPAVIKAVTGEVVSAEDLGGPQVHMNTSGVIHFVAEDDKHALDITRRLLSFLPSNNLEDPPQLEAEETILPNKALNNIVPLDPKLRYDVRDVIVNIFDKGDFMEIQAGYATNIVIGFARLQGRTVGVIANQPNAMAGVLDINCSDKAARFIRFCNAFNIPLITFVDTPGFMPGVQQEYGGIIRHGAKMLFAYSAATVPKLTVELRKSYGGANLAMCAKDLGADRVLAWPTAEIAVMGAEGAVDVIFRKELKEAADPKAKRQELIDEYRENFANPFAAAACNQVDDVIEPAYTRRELAMALDILYRKRELRPAKKHGLIPL